MAKRLIAVMFAVVMLFSATLVPTSAPTVEAHTVEECSEIVISLPPIRITIEICEEIDHEHGDSEPGGDAAPTSPTLEGSPPEGS